MARAESTLISRNKLVVAVALLGMKLQGEGIEALEEATEMIGILRHLLLRNKQRRQRSPLPDAETVQGAPIEEELESLCLLKGTSLLGNSNNNISSSNSSLCSMMLGGVLKQEAMNQEFTSRVCPRLLFFVHSLLRRPDI